MITSALIKLRTGLIVVFGLTLLAILIQLCYVLWRRRLFKRRHFSGAESDITTTTTGGNNYPSYAISSPSKELLYFLCWKNQSRVEPTFRSSTDDDQEPAQTSVDEFKLQEVLYGPSRFLFTIKEEKEEFEYSDHQNKSGLTDDDDQMIKDKKMVSLEECLFDQRSTRGEVVDDDDEDTSMVKIMINDDDVDDDEEGEGESGQFSTPCGSPPYYTPTPSPSRDDHDNGNLTQIDGGVLVDVDDQLERKSRLVNNKECFVCLGV